MTTANESEQIAYVVDLFRDRLNLEIGDPDTDLIEEGLLDSLLLVDLIVYLEANHGISISLENFDIDRFRSIRSISRWIDSSEE